MSQFTQRTIFSVGLATLALALAPAAQAQIQVTGGVIDGEAAFFNPTSGTAPISLFDLNITNLQIVSPNGVLTNPDFVPTASGGFVDVDNMDDVSAGDTGLIVGNLSGIGFDSGGSIVPFSNVTTALAYQVSRFDVTNTLTGVLVDGESIPQLFFEGTNAAALNVSNAFTEEDGDLEVGDFNSNITAGVIDLPNTLDLSSTGSFSSVFNLTASDDDLGTGSSASRAFTDDDDEFDLDDDDDDSTPVNLVFNFNGTNVNFTTTQTFTVNGSTNFTTTSSTSLDEVRTLIEEILDDLDVEALGSTATLAIFTGEGGNNATFEVVNSPTYNIRVRQNRRGNIKIKIKVKKRGSRRHYLAVRGNVLIGGFVQIGPASRAFPGMVGLETLSEEEAEELYAELLADEAADGDDDGDDVADDDDGDDDDDIADDDDGDDDDGEDVADDDDGDDDDGEDVAEEEPTEGAAFEGLDSLSDEDVDAINEQIDSAGTEPSEAVTPSQGLDSIDATTPEEAIAQ